MKQQPPPLLKKYKVLIHRCKCSSRFHYWWGCRRGKIGHSGTKSCFTRCQGPFTCWKLLNHLSFECLIPAKKTGKWKKVNSRLEMKCVVKKRDAECAYLQFRLYTDIVKKKDKKGFRVDNWKTWILWRNYLLLDIHNLEQLRKTTSHWHWQLAADTLLRE